MGPSGTFENPNAVPDIFRGCNVFCLRSHVGELKIMAWLSLDDYEAIVAKNYEVKRQFMAWMEMVTIDEVSALKALKAQQENEAKKDKLMLKTTDVDIFKAKFQGSKNVVAHQSDCSTNNSSKPSMA